MPDYLYEVRLYVDVSLIPRGVGGTLLAQQNSNIPGIGSTDTPGAGPVAQTLRLQKRQPVGNAIATPPVATDIQNAMNAAVTALGSALTPTVMANIGNWALGSN